MINITHWIVSFALGNYVYQALQDNPDWMVASERSFFQTAMGLVIMFMLKQKGMLRD